LRSAPLTSEGVEDIAQEVLLQVVANDYAVLKQFRGKSSLATYLTVIARRICVHQLAKIAPAHKPLPAEMKKSDEEEHPRARIGLERQEEVLKLLRRLPSREREVVRLFYLEGRSYEEISAALNMPVNTIGPVLSRAKKRLKASANGSPSAEKPTKGKTAS
jgi:RNA polymerase sigma-70 factor (ECF subfamily)